MDVTELEEILILEEQFDYEKALIKYQEQYACHAGNFQVWKHFYFFLWATLDEAPLDFIDTANIRSELNKTFLQGKALFSEFPEFNFIAGFTISIFAYEFGDFDTMLAESKKMLLKATKLEPNNLIYRLGYLGSIENMDERRYQEAVTAASSSVLQTYKGRGFLNTYFRIMFTVRNS